MGEVQGERYKVIIRLDPACIPADEQKIKFETYTHYDMIGEYVASEGIVSFNDGDFVPLMEVFSWEPLDK